MRCLVHQSQVLIFRSSIFINFSLGESDAPLLVDLNSRFANIVSRNATVIEERNRLNDQLNQQEDNHKGKNLTTTRRTKTQNFKLLFLDELAKIKAFYEQEVHEGMKLLNNSSNEAFKLRQDLENAIEKKNEAEKKYEEKNLSVSRFPQTPLNKSFRSELHGN